MTDKTFSTVLKKLATQSAGVLDIKNEAGNYVPLDLSETNETLNTVDVSSSDKLGVYINQFLKEQQAQVAYGGYLEVRNIYKRSQHFNKQAQTERNIHIGLDLWCAVETPIFTPLPAEVHSFKNNTNFGDYGPTIILKHTLEDVEFYTLYGHLSLDSIKDLKLGQVFKKGEQIATLGDASVNGDYPPHLHFQIIKNIEANFGDYPGVCSKTDVDFYKSNCPNPNLLLGF